MFLGKQCHSSRGAHSAFKCIVPIAGAGSVLSRTQPHWWSGQYVKSHPAWHAWCNGRREFVRSTEHCPDSGWPVGWLTLCQVDMRMQNPCPDFPCAPPNIQKPPSFLPVKRLRTTDHRKHGFTVCHTTTLKSQICFRLSSNTSCWIRISISAQTA